MDPILRMHSWISFPSNRGRIDNDPQIALGHWFRISYTGLINVGRDHQFHPGIRAIVPRGTEFFVILTQGTCLSSRRESKSLLSQCAGYGKSWNLNSCWRALASSFLFDTSRVVLSRPIWKSYRWRQMWLLWIALEDCADSALARSSSMNPFNVIFPCASPESNPSLAPYSPSVASVYVGSGGFIPIPSCQIKAE